MRSEPPRFSSLNACAKHYKISRSNLKLLIDSGGEFKGSGPRSTIFLPEEETKLKMHILHMLEIGYGLTMFDLRLLVQVINQYVSIVVIYVIPCSRTKQL